MSDLLTEHLVVDVGVSIDVNEPHRTVLFGHGPKNRQHNCVVPAHRNRDQVVGQQLPVVVGDSINRIEQIVGIGGDVACVVDPQAVERRSSGGHVVGTKQNRLAAYASRPESSSRPIGSADVERHSDDRYIELVDRRRSRQTHEGGNASETRHLVPAERLRVGHLGRLTLEGTHRGVAGASCRGSGWPRPCEGSGPCLHRW